MYYIDGIYFNYQYIYDPTRLVVRPEEAKVETAIPPCDLYVQSSIS